MSSSARSTLCTGWHVSSVLISSRRESGRRVAVRGMALASMIDPNRLDLCFLEAGFPVAHVYSTGAGWNATGAESGWDHLGGMFNTPPVMVATKATPQVVIAPADPPAPPHH